MSNLSEAVRHFIARTERDGGVPAPGSLEWLKRQARASFDGAFRALHAPMAPFTWDAQASLAGNSDASTGRVPITFRGPVEIIGLRPSIVQKTRGALVVPTAEDIIVEFDGNDEARFTNTLGDSSSATSGSSTSVVLASLGVQTPRLMGIKLENDKPNIGVKFRWRIQPVGGAAVFEDADIRLSFYCRWL